MRIVIALLILVTTLSVGVVPQGAALTRSKASDHLPQPVRFDNDGSGLLTDVWINGAGPFNFAIDTGAGITIITRRVAANARLQVHDSSRPLVGGLSATTITSREETLLSRIALGNSNNVMRSTTAAAVVESLPGSLDGILDPVDAFRPFGFTIDLPNLTITAFDPASNKLRVGQDGAIVKWVRESGSHKPFVKLSDGRLALIDTGSSFGFAFNGGFENRTERVRNVNDLGGEVRSQKVAPMTINIGELELRSVPTDILIGAAPDVPAILGRRALYPFKLTFDPVARLIAIEPAK